MLNIEPASKRTCDSLAYLHGSNGAGGVEKYEMNGRWWVKTGIGGAEDEFARLFAGLEERIEKPEDVYGRDCAATLSEGH